MAERESMEEGGDEMRRHGINTIWLDIKERQRTEFVNGTRINQRQLDNFSLDGALELFVGSKRKRNEVKKSWRSKTISNVI